MATLFRMPGVSADADEAVLEAWTVQQGATITSGQAIASVETEKAVVEVESDVDAVVHALLVANGATVPVGDPIAVLLEVGEDPSAGEKLLSELGLGTDAPAETENAIASAPEEAQAPPASAAATQVDTRVPAADVSAAPSGRNGGVPAADRNGGRVFASPIARKLAREKGIDFCKVELTTLQGHMVSSSDDSTYASFTLQGYVV